MWPWWGWSCQGVEPWGRCGPATPRLPCLTWRLGAGLPTPLPLQRWELMPHVCRVLPGLLLGPPPRAPELLTPATVSWRGPWCVSCCPCPCPLGGRGAQAPSPGGRRLGPNRERLHRHVLFLWLLFGGEKHVENAKRGQPHLPSWAAVRKFLLSGLRNGRNSTHKPQTPSRPACRSQPAPHLAEACHGKAISQIKYQARGLTSNL